MDDTESTSSPVEEVSLLSNEEKLRTLLTEMRSSIEQNTSPQFKTFWQAREQCIPLFKEGIHPAVRSLLWQQFRDLSKEARMLSDLLGEQAAFAGEQIAIAIGALEKEIENAKAQMESLPPLSLPMPSKVLEGQLKAFDPLHRELTLYNRWTNRVAALRKELIATEMRVREKNGLFKRLSTLGDRAFPKRRELIEEVSARFCTVVERFVSAHFSEEGYAAPFFVVKNEIKALQSFAKTIALTSKAFKEVRYVLSECWDKVRASEKEKRDEAREKQAADNKIAEKFIQEVAAAKETLQGEELRDAIGQVKKKLGTVQLERGALRTVQANIHAVECALADEAKRVKEAFVNASKECALALKEEVQTLLKEGKSLSGDELAKQRTSLAQKIVDAEITTQDRHHLEGQLGKVADLIIDAEENTFLNTPDDHPEVVSRLQMALERKSRRRSGIKERLEELRKEAGGSSLDFEAGLFIDAKVKEEKEKLSHLESAIKGIEARLKQLQT